MVEMADQKDRNLNILAAVQAALGALISSIILILFKLNPNYLRDAGLSWVVVILGFTVVGYFLSAHQLIRYFSTSISVFIMSCISIANLVLVIAQTGGLDSPYNAFLILALVTTGLFSLVATIIGLTALITYYVVAFAQHHFESSFLAAHLIQFVMMLSAGGLALWVHNRGRKTVAQTQQMASLSGQLGEEQLKAQVLMNSMGEGVVVVNTSRHVQLFNPAAQALTGWDAATAQNLNYLTIMGLKKNNDSDVTDADDPFLQAWEKKATVIRSDLILGTKSGRKVALTMTVSPIYDGNNNISGGIALFRDISQEKEVERQRNEFISTASHEMRTPVAAIEGYIALAMNPDISTIDERARGFLGKAHDSIQHLGALFKDLLSVTKVEEGKIGGAIEPVEIGKMVREVVSDMQFNAQKKNLTLLLQSGGMTLGDKDVMPLFMVKGNGERLREVTMNLIENALKYTQQGGITVDVSGTKDLVTVKVIDTGVGIAAEDITHLFQKFYRVDSTATRTIGGTGLGLYLVRTIIEYFNGRAWVESILGRGSTFAFSLPRVANDATAASLNDAAAATAQAPGSILPSPSPKPAPAPTETIIHPVVVAAPAVQEMPVPASMQSTPLPESSLAKPV